MNPSTTPKMTVDLTKIPESIEKEIQIFEKEAARFKGKQLSDEQFRGFRLAHGIYGQRQAGVQMFRIKIPQGRLNPVQLRRLADLSDNYSTGVSHISTRQNFQMHYVQLEHVSTMMRLIAEVGLTTREACADTVRNITACPLAGVSPTEVVDVTPYGQAITNAFLRNPICQRLPRKFKIALEGCTDIDHAVTFIHDIGIRARLENGKIGFRVTVGGGLGSTPHTESVLLDFAAPEDLVAICEAIIKVFDRHGPRQNRYKARMKFLVKKMGLEKFKGLWLAEFTLIKSQNGHYTLPKAEARPRTEPAEPRQWKREEASGAFAAWLRYNVHPQRQSGFHFVNVKVLLGDIKSQQLRDLAALVEQFTEGNLRISIQQNLVLRWIHDADLPALYEGLTAADLADAGAERIEDIVACPGSDTCGLSLTSSKGIARELAKLFPSGDENHDDLNGSTIKISGCPNSCAQHHLATIGLHGVGKKVGGHTAPFYEIHMGGSDRQIATQMIKVPAKRVPEAVKETIRWYRDERKQNESLEAFFTRQGKEKSKKILMPFTFLPKYDQERDFYVDWGDNEDFSTADLGPGECAGGAYQLMEGFLFEADQEVYLAGVMADSDQSGQAVNQAYRAVVAAAKGLLVLEGMESSIDAEVIEQAETHLIAKGTIPKKFANLAGRLNDTGSSKPSKKWLQERIAFAKDFVTECHKAFDLVGSDLKKKKAEEGFSNESLKQRTGSDKINVHFDLKGVSCPINYVKTKLRMEEMEIGERIEILLDEGEPITNVPRSLTGDGQKILLQEKIDANHFRLVVEKIN